MEIKIGSHILNDKSRPLIIAEIADSHLGSLEIAKQLVLQAKINGADFAKFQYHIPEEEMIPGSIKMWDGDLYQILKRNLFSHEQHREIKNYCEEVGIIYLCTPFSMLAVDRLEELGVHAYKIGSGEMQNLPFVEYVASKGKPVFLSTGMSTIEEVEESVAVLKNYNTQFVLFYCVSEYPPKYKNIHLHTLNKYKEKFTCLIGLSDHSPTIWTAVGSVTLGVNLIEKHFTLNKNLPGPDHFISLTPEELRLLKEGIDAVWEASGVFKGVTKAEGKVREWAYHSLVSSSDIDVGEILTEELFSLKRPGTGIPAKELKKYLGKKLKRAVKKDTLFEEEDFY